MTSMNTGFCFFCKQPTEHRLTGKATVGAKLGEYEVFVCPGDWYLFEKKMLPQGEELLTEIAEQILRWKGKQPCVS